MNYLFYSCNNISFDDINQFVYNLFIIEDLFDKYY